MKDYKQCDRDNENCNKDFERCYKYHEHCDYEKLIEECEHLCLDAFTSIERIALFNQEKVLKAFQNNRVALRHFAPTTGYGYDDIGKNTLSSIFAEVFQSEAAIVSPHLASGTHAIAAVLFGLLRPDDRLLSINGDPYDTLMPVILGKNNGSLRDFGVIYQSIPLKNDKFDYDAIADALKSSRSSGTDYILLQRSGGYNFREAFSIEELENVISFIKGIKNVAIIVDNCYGEFTSTKEPIEIGANVVVGSLIKNPGGGLAPTGGYICGDKHLLEKIEGRLTAPGIGCEVGSYAHGYQYFYQGLFMAPHTVEQAMKSSVIFGRTFERLGYKTLPRLKDSSISNVGNNSAGNSRISMSNNSSLLENSLVENNDVDQAPKNNNHKYTDSASDSCQVTKNSHKDNGINDIIRSIVFENEDELIRFCQSIQKCSPIDSFVVPEPWDMPGYSHKVIMAAGAFTQGASIELSADSPIKSPYVAYLQGALTYEHAKIALKNCLKNILEKN